MKPTLLDLAERGWLPDPLLRAGIRRLLRARLAEERESAHGDAARAEAELAARLADAPIALVPELANAQHYEVQPDFFRAVLGPRLKYSCAWFADPRTTLAQAEEDALGQVCARAELADGMRVLDLGCGWGSFALFAAERFPNARIVALSNSKLQREHILAECARRGFGDRVDVVTGDFAALELAGRFDRVVSIEMFEHLRNWDAALARIAGWLAPGGKLFVHVFCHRAFAYLFEARAGDDWMARQFFSGGMMPSAGLIRRFDRALGVEREWRIAGAHYARTAAAWLANLDRNRAAATRALAAGADPAAAARAFHRWRLFLLAVAELFAANAGTEWHVAQYRLVPAEPEAAP